MHKSNNVTKEFVNKFKAKFLSLIFIGDGCCVWHWSVDACGYGRFGVGKGKTMAAHRFSYALFKEELDSNSLILHTCDNPGCVNPHHLYLGTDKNNTDDSINRNRRSRILDIDEVKKIKELWNTGKYTQTTLGYMFDTHQTEISRIVNDKRWVEYLN